VMVNGHVSALVTAKQLVTHYGTKRDVLLFQFLLNYFLLIIFQPRGISAMKTPSVQFKSTINICMAQKSI